MREFAEESKSISFRCERRKQNYLCHHWKWIRCFVWAVVFLLGPHQIYSQVGESKSGEADAISEHLKSSTNSEEHDNHNGLPDDAHLLAGTTPLDDVSSHSCTCHSSSKTSKITSSCRNTHQHYVSEHCGARIFYLIGIHNQRTLDDSLHLFRSIRDPRNTILIHFDTKFGLNAYRNSSLHKEINACPCGSHVEVASIYDCAWGTWTMNLPTLWSLEKAVKDYAGKWDVFINLSGDTLPVYTQDRIAEMFAGPLANTNFVTSSACETGLRPTPITAFPKSWHKRSHYSHKPPNNLEYVDDHGVTHHNVSVEVYFGSQWMSLTPHWCEFLTRQLERPDSLPSRFRDWLIETQKLMADETFFPSMMMHFFPDSLPNITDDYFLARDDVDMYAIRYERMDEHVPSSSGWFPTDQRYEVPESSGISKPHAWGPYYLGVYDLNNIRESGALFVRKVASAIDLNMYKVLPVDDARQIPPIEWPKEVKVSPVPNWEKILAMYKRKAESKQTKELSKAEETPKEEKEEESSSSDDADHSNGAEQRELV
ncbi:core-2/I-branching enzyme [Nitzschia inconspicua]|uniref:protein xylosyltransferase n=1 Tax=Nitzschia inconspicua TaxID=303405 RepID=A0A9K3LUB7_9STRA|nr:core-2/I-branching enzyme [Nitzschia inconspicua]